MESQARILITGAAGMVGQALTTHLKQKYKNVVALTRNECDLEHREQTLNFFKHTKPDYVFHLAAKVGGIKANMTSPVEFLNSNVLMTCHTLEACHQVKVKKVLLLGSSCIYPRECPQPMREEYLLTGPLEPTNEGYALAKIVGLKLARYYHDQYKMNIVCPMPSNIYGPNDTFDLEKSHVLSALVRRFVDAREQKQPSVTLWGSGKARRELIHVRDVVSAMLFFMQSVNTPDIINVGPGNDFSIAELAQMIAKQVGYSGSIEWDLSRPDGMPRKCMDVSQLTRLGFKCQVSLLDGIKEVIADYTENHMHN